MGSWTPGPWYVVEYEGDDGHGLGIDADDGTAVVWYAHSVDDGIQHARDAHLIAAAPELFEACEAALNLICGDGWDGNLGHHPKNPVQAKLRSARAKARGESHG